MRTSKIVDMGGFAIKKKYETVQKFNFEENCVPIL